MKTQADKAHAFRALHERSGAFIIPNPWDAGSARILASFGFEALATTSAGAAFSAGRRDGAIGREAMLAHVASIVEATDLPVSADLEGGYANDENGVAETFRLAAAAGIVGASIEDATGDREHPLLDIDRAAARVRAAIEAVRASPFPFTLTARAENFLRGNPDLDDTIRRLQAFEKAGADVLFAPGLPDLAAVRAVCAALTKPVNFMAGIKGRSFSVAELEAAGVRRISLATSLFRAAMTGLVNAAREVKEHGTFGYLDASLGTPQLNTLLDMAAPKG